MRLARTLIGTALFVLSLGGTSHLAAAEKAVQGQSAQLQQLQVELRDALTRGKDVKAIVDRIKALNPTPTISAFPARSTEASDYNQRLSEFQKLIQQVVQQNTILPTDANRLLASYEALQAAHMLLLERFNTVKTKLSSSVSPSQFEQRRSDAEGDYKNKSKQLFTLLRTTLDILQSSQDKESLINNSNFNGQLLIALRRADVFIRQNNAQPASKILRNNLLPFSSVNLAQRTPKTTPVITPSYATAGQTVAITMEDLASTPDAPLSEEILKKARELENDYIKIYEFVQSEIATEWYAGSMKGAVNTLRQGSGNDVDQASLLIALFRASSLPARYVQGVVELPIESVGDSLGLTDPASIAQALTRAGVAYTPKISGGRIASVEINRHG